MQQMKFERGTGTAEKRTINESIYKRRNTRRINGRTQRREAAQLQETFLP